MGPQDRLTNVQTAFTPEQLARPQIAAADGILHPKAKIVEGYTDLMPTFEGQLSEEQLIQLIAYIRAVGPE